MTLDEMYAQMLGVMPAGDAMLDAPVAGQSPYLPPWQSEAMGMPFPTSLAGGAPPMGEVPESAQPDPMLGVTSAFGQPATAPDQYGYNPQPRPMLPAPITEDAAGLYGPFRGIWDQMQQEEEDPLAAMMAGGGMGQQPPSRGFGQQPYQQQQMPQSRGEGALRDQGYGRAMDRMNWLRGLRASKGY